MKTETAGSSESFVFTYELTRRHNPEKQRRHRCEILESHKTEFQTKNSL
jgi:hypothetical protein